MATGGPKASAGGMQVCSEMPTAFIALKDFKDHISQPKKKTKLSKDLPIGPLLQSQIPTALIAPPDYENYKHSGKEHPKPHPKASMIPNSELPV